MVTLQLPYSAAHANAPPPGPRAALPQASFRAPAHRHAHHLHSIPPREKSARTLIIDHMLWAHGRTRFAQARAELGMTDRTGGPASLNYVHRSRPEGYEEDDEQDSDGEDVSPLKTRTGAHDDNNDDERSRRQDLPLARTLRLRAEGLEKVITSMLDQPPPIHPLTDDDTNLKALHRLPNGLRLRLALGTIINDLFARQSFHLPYRHAHQRTFGQPPPAFASPSDLPDVLRPLAPVSRAFVPRYQRLMMHGPAFSDFQCPQPPPNNPPGSGQFPFQSYRTPPPPTPKITTLPRPNQRTKELYFNPSTTASCPPALRCPRHLHAGCQICTKATSPTANGGGGGRARSSANGRSSRVVGVWKASVVGPQMNAGGLGHSISGFQEGTGVGSGLLRPSLRGTALRRRTANLNNNNNNNAEDSTTTTTTALPDAGSGNTMLSKLIPRFLRLSALVAAELGREARGEEVEGDDSEDERGRAPGPSTAEDVEGAAMSPRSLNHVGTPGRPWTGGAGALRGNPNVQAQSQRTPPQNQATTTTAAVAAAAAASRRRERSRMYENALRPSRAWYMLLAGLLTRAALEGYLATGWSGLNAVQCVLLVGLGINERIVPGAGAGAGASSSAPGKRKDPWVGRDGNGYDDDASDDDDDDDDGNDGNEEDDDDDEDEDDDNDDDDDSQFGSFDPDELPDLTQAVKILFPSLRDASFGVPQDNNNPAEEEYELEMLERLRRFYDVPPSTPDRSIHMGGLAWQYPAEPVERAAVRYCEAIAEWRGKPELETYKKKPPSSSSSRTTTTSSTSTSTSSISLTMNTNTNTNTNHHHHSAIPLPSSSSSSSSSSSAAAAVAAGGGTSSSLSPMTIESLVHSNPASPHRGFSTTSTATPCTSISASAATGSTSSKSRKPSIDLYFPPVVANSNNNGNGSGRAQQAQGGPTTIAPPRSAPAMMSMSMSMSSSLSSSLSSSSSTGMRPSVVVAGNGNGIVGAGGAGGGGGGGGWMPITSGRVNNALKRYRDVEDVGRVNDAKRMYTA